MVAFDPLRRLALGDQHPTRVVRLIGDLVAGHQATGDRKPKPVPV